MPLPSSPASRAASLALAPQPVANRRFDPRMGLRRIFLRDFEILASVGVHAFEHETPQRILLNLELAVVDNRQTAHGAAGAEVDDLGGVVDYEVVANRVRQVVLDGHTQLLETLCERIAEVCLTDPRVRVVRVRIDKPDIFADMASVGVEIERNAQTLQRLP